MHDSISFEAVIKNQSVEKSFHEYDYIIQYRQSIKRMFQIAINLSLYHLT